MREYFHKKILIVDDFQTMVRLIAKIMDDIGFKNVDTANNGEEAWDLIQKNDYALIISDWNMEPVTGLELLKRVREHEKTAATPFILVTAESKPENVIAARDAGVSNYIVKPFNAATMQSKLQKVLKSKD